MVRRRAPAKINLYLHVTGRRDDGYHLLESLIAFAGVEDVVEVEPGPDRGLELTVAGPFADELAGSAGAGAGNIVLRAARALARVAGREPDASMRLVKNLPVAAGLGGGSADAGAALRALAALWEVRLPDEELAALALGLGADVPACLAGRPVLVSGIGETLRPAPALPPVHLLLVNPSVALATADVFAAFEARTRASPPPLTDPPADAAALAARLAERRNDLEDAARRLAPAIDAALGWLGGRSGCLLARMSGSGATCFGLFADPEAARVAEEETRIAHPGWWARAAPLLAAREREEGWW